MAKFVVIDELRLAVRVPAEFSDRRVRAAVRALARRKLMARLRRTLREALWAVSGLGDCRVTLDR